ncbi:hypothetical protein DMC30DRAFT_396449 [Rhodotorula diobovata]|uniref:Secreted protein n=1 Tax=Rhodotorula diobovata TaxID=5288 RepID=A0A5C5FVJ9_9BASI|nr:hypothetical protein DMC30DRAFT_396449 [Rhodotorula diobovata]
MPCPRRDIPATRSLRWLALLLTARAPFAHPTIASTYTRPHLAHARPSTHKLYTRVRMGGKASLLRPEGVVQVAASREGRLVTQFEQGACPRRPSRLSTDVPCARRLVAV